MYPCELSRSVTPDLPDSVSESGSLVENSTIRAKKVGRHTGNSEQTQTVVEPIASRLLVILYSLLGTLFDILDVQYA